jgi:hypothetical protein
VFGVHVIVVVSTAANQPDAARRCAQSVARDEHDGHYFAAPDCATEREAQAYGATTVPDRGSQIGNLVGIVSGLAPDTIVIHLDGDDELTPGAVARVEQEYEDPNVWLTYGSFRRSDGVRDRAWHEPFGTRYGSRPRQERWRASHLRTFRAGLFHAIPRSYLIDPQTGSYFRTCVDRAIMLPMIEMAGERYSVIQDVLCIYNHDHDRSMTEAERAEESRTRNAVHSMTALAPLGYRPW